MEIALLAGKYVLVMGIYAFVWMVYRGLVAESRAERQEETVRQAARAEVPRMSGAAGVVAPRRVPAPPRTGETAPRADSLRSPETPAPPSSAASVRSVLAEEAPGERPEERHVPALLARDLPGEIARVEVAPLEPAEPEGELEIVMVPPVASRAATDCISEIRLTPVVPEPGTLVAGAATPRLVVLRSESVELPPGREFPLLAAATIGRAEHNLVVLPDTFVSSQHALIFLKEGRRVLRDRGSTNGTLVNGHRVNGDHILRDGDQIAVGTSVLRYVEPTIANL